MNTLKTAGEAMESAQKLSDLVAAAGASPAQPLPTMADALAAGDGCLHGLIDKLQARVVELEAQPSQALELSDEFIERLKHVPSVSGALDAYASAIKRWGKEDNTPLPAMAAESAAIRSIVIAAINAKGVKS